ncbi:phosphoribosylformylglycinamidine synthase subunit PurL [candidate division WOR-3 bacterium]|nr:phosphoribosylformylglycinamidine synthase subunit PurL [candidate division WOR-3 bacterium]
MRRIEIKRKDKIRGERIKQDMHDLGLSANSVEVLDVYLLYGDITDKQFEKIVEIVMDSVYEEWGLFEFPENARVIEIALNPGVMDPVAIDSLEVARKLGIKLDGIKILKKYIFYDTDDKTINLAKGRILLNPLIQHVVKGEEKLEGKIESKQKTPTVDLPSMNSEELLQLSRTMGLFLNQEEMKVISIYFSKEGKNPTIAELETFGILWSEHCSHKTMRGNVKILNLGAERKPRTFTKVRGGSEIRNLLKSTIMKVTEELKKPWVLSAFKDNAGIIEFNDKYAVCFKVETHNHPSALEPFGGSATGIGGVIRDILGCGLGAKPIANTDIFCVGNLDQSYSSLLKGVLHPRRILRGIVAGVADYGNKMGIPTINGSVTYHRDYTTNPLVYCGCIGMMPKNTVDKQVNNGDLVILVGGKTGRDGIHGATFSSGVMDETTQSEFGSAVQIGDPLREKNLLDALLIAREKALYNSITDCGAGGICTSVSELAEGIGVEVQLENVPLKYKGLSPTEIWVSESQERMVLAASGKNLKELKRVFDEYGSELTVIGRFVNSNRVKVRYKEKVICDIDLKFLIHGMPKIAKKALLPIKKDRGEGSKKIDKKFDKNLDVILMKMLSHPDIASKEWIVRQYDHEVQGATVIKPLNADAAVLKPLFIEGNKGIVVAHGLAPFYEDSYNNAASSLDEAVRNICATGGDPSQIALLDNFSWGNPEDQENMGKLVRACEALYDVAIVYSMPFISGKDSLYNEYESKNGKQSVPPTILVSGIGIIDDVNKTVTQNIKFLGNPVYIIGHTYPELGNSLLHRILQFSDGEEPDIRPERAIELYKRLYMSIKEGMVVSCHDCSEGGFGVALAEMCFGSGFGLQINLDNIPSSGLREPFSILFSESNSRFILEVDIKKKYEFEDIMTGVSYAQIGDVISTNKLIINNLLNIDITKLETKWKSKKL